MTLDVPERLTKPKHPYPGLRAFEPNEWSIFFGRDRMVDDVIDRLARDRMVFVHGASGCGKSSLVRAGVLPRLAREQRREGGTWRGCLMRPSGGPLWNLAQALAGLEGRETDLDRIEALLRRCNVAEATLSSVTEALEGMAGERICILIDQFEELFRFAKETSREEAEVFVSLLTRERTRQDGQAHVVLTMRSEFLGDCARYEGLAETINATQYLVPRMERDELKRAIERPAQLFGGEATPGLAERLIAEARGQDDELPLIQHGLMLIWNEAAARAAKGETIRLDARLIDEAGSLAELLSAHADRVLNEAIARLEVRGPGEVAQPKDRAAPGAQNPPEPLRVAETIFRALTDINADGQALRRPQSFRDLVAVCGGAEEEARAIIDAFRAEGVSFLTPYPPAPIEAKTVIDIGHESVIRCWRKIAEPRVGWLAKEFRDGRAWALLLQQAERFQTSSDLLSAARTEESQKFLINHNEPWAKRYGGEWALVGALIDASAAAREAAARAAEAARRAAWWRQILFGGAALAFLGVAAVAGWQWWAAADAEREAQAQRQQAEKTLRLATATANGLVNDLAKKFRNVAGVKAEVVSDILDRARRLQEQLAAGGAAGADLQQGQAKALFETVRSRLDMGDVKGALDAAQGGVKIMEALSASDPRNVGWRGELSEGYFWLGRVLQAQGHLTGALKAFRDSLAIREALSAADAGNAGLRGDLSASYVSVGDVLQVQGDLTGALKAYRDSLAIREALSAADPGDAKWQSVLSWSHEMIGDVLQAQGDLAEALRSYRDSLAIMERLSASDPGNGYWRMNFAASQARVGDVLRAQGDLAGALKSFQDAVTTMEALSAADLGNTKWRRDLSLYYVKVGGVLQAQGDLAGALKAYRDSLAIREALSAADPGNTEWRRDLSVSHERVGEVLQAQGDLAGALKAFRDYLAIMQALSAADPDNAQWRRDLSNSYAWIGYVCLQMKNPPQAREALDKGRAIIADLVAKHPDWAEWKQDLAWFDARLAELKKAAAHTPRRK